MQIDHNALSKWFEERPRWMREALDLILTAGVLTADNLHALAGSCRTKGDSKKLAPLAAGVFAPKAAGQTLRLKSLSEPKGIEALNPRAPLLFGSEPITIVYGHNGAGKSGYIRILNNACGSKNRRLLLGHVFQGAAVQSCKIAYEIGGVPKELVWQPSHGQQAELAGLEIYDTESGQVYVNAENEVAFEPWLLGVFQQLIDACGQIDGILAREMAALVSAKPAMPGEYAGTAAALWYSVLKATTTAQEIATWTAWSAAQQDELAGLQARLLEKNPADQAKSLRIRSAAIRQFVVDWQAIAAALSMESVAALLAAKADAAAKRKAASEDAAKVFAEAPLAGVGLESWKLLWQQARAYSEKNAYPEKKFPVIGPDARCVLCQQVLDDGAEKRMDGFERFVKGELETLALAAESQFAQLIEAIPAVPSADDLKTRQATLGLDAEELLGKLTAYREGLAARSSALPGAIKIEDVPALPEPALLDDLPEIVLALEKQAKAFEEDAAKTDKAALKKSVREAEGRKWLAEQKSAVEAEVARLQKVSSLEVARRLTNTTALSTKKSELAQQLVSDAFIQRFNGELATLGASRINVGLVQTRTAKGHVYHQIQLKGAKLKASTSDVLSEGERRVVSLAAFLSANALLESGGRAAAARHELRTKWWPIRTSKRPWSRVWWRWQKSGRSSFSPIGFRCLRY